MKKKNIFCLCILLFVLLSCTACGNMSGNTKVVLTTGLNKDEVFRIETVSCSKQEMMVYITNMQNQYENVYGTEIWDTETNGQTLEESVKENALAKMAQVKTMNLMAEEMGIELTNAEIKQVENAGDIYYNSLNNTEIAQMEIDRDTIVSLYKEYLIAQKVYQEIIKDINPEVSDDEARNITVQYIFIKTYTQDGSGKKHQYADNEKKSAYAKAEEAYERAKKGEDFESLIAEYGQAEVSTQSFGKGDISSDYVRSILFDLANNEISSIITTDDGYIIAKCISTYDLDETDLNKIAIVEEAREAVFGQEYDSFVDGITRKLNDTLWDEITFLHSPDITTSDFFIVADENLSL